MNKQECWARPKEYIQFWTNKWDSLNGVCCLFICFGRDALLDFVYSAFGSGLSEK